MNTKNTQTVVSRALQGIQDNEEYIIDDDNIRKSGGQARHVQRENRRRDLYRSQHERAVQHDARINNIFISGILLALGLTAVLGVILSHTITNPIKELTKHARAVADGRFTEKTPVFGGDEIGQLSQAFNYMTSRLREALSQNEEEKEKLASILTNMSDGVIATDEAGRVILMNRRAGEMLGVEGEELAGHDIVSRVLRSPNRRRWRAPRA